MNTNNQNKKISICLFIVGFHDGGIEKMMENYFSNMDRSMFDLHIAIHLDNNPSRRKRFEEMGFSVHVLSFYHGHKVGIKNYKEYQELFASTKFDIIHNNCVQYILPLYFAKKYHIPVRILHSHSDFYDAFREKSLPAKALYRMVINYNANLATTYFACGERAGISAFGKKRIPITHLIKNAVDVDLFSYNIQYRNRIRAQHGLGEGMVFGHVGRYEDRFKNQEFVVAVFAEIKKERRNSKLIMLGDGERKKTVEALVNQYGLSEDVIFTGNVTNVNEYLSAMDYFIFPSLYEGFSQVVVEAQCSGLHGIMTDTLSQEMNLLGTFITASLDDSAKKWAQSILEHSNYERTDVRQQIIDAGYDIKTEAIDLQKKYCELSDSNDKS